MVRKQSRRTITTKLKHNQFDNVCSFWEETHLESYILNLLLQLKQNRNFLVGGEG